MTLPLCAIGGGLLLLIAAAWIERRPIAARLIDRRLAAAGVPAHYRIATLDPVTQRMEDVRIGDAAHPDLFAESVVLHWRYGIGGPVLSSVSARGVRLKATWRDGKLSLGTIDRLLPRTGNGGAVLPDLDATVEDGVVTVLTPAGELRAVVAGHGNLRRNFGGVVALSTRTLATGGCAIDGARARLTVRIADRVPRVSGPVEVGTTVCPGRALTVGSGRAMVDARSTPGLDTAVGRLDLRGFAGRVGRSAFDGIGGTIAFTTDARTVRGRAAVALVSPRAPGGSARRATVDGDFVLASASSRFVGRLGLVDADPAPALRRSLSAAVAATNATPVATTARRFGGALAALTGGAAVEADVDWVGGGAARVLRVPRMGIRGRGGERALLSGRFDEDAVRWTAAATLSGPDMPGVALQAGRKSPAAPVIAALRMHPYTASGARLALAPVRLLIDRGEARFATAVTINGPVGGGRVEGLAVPIEGTRDRAGVIRIGQGCATVGFRRLRLPSLTLDPATLRVCGAPLVTIGRDGGVRFAGEARTIALNGRSGTAPVRIDAGTLRLGQEGIAIEHLGATLGAPADPTRLALASLAGRFSADGATGRFTGASGSIARVPLALSGAAGEWRFRRGALHLGGGLRVGDRAGTPRFLPLVSDDVALELDRGIVDASGTLIEPRTRATVARVTLHHVLGTGEGTARLAVPGIRFVRGGLQPEMLTPLTVGVVANLSGAVAGEGLIRWSPGGTSSTGRFHSDGIDLAAAFGPVVGIQGSIDFTDLLGLVTAPHQRARVAQINPGVVVADGIVTYQLIGGDRVAIEGARWPFAGGALTLDSATLDFSQPTERRLTFRIAGLDAAAFIQQLDFPNISATGTFDGRLPMVFDTSGGRIEDGDLTSRGAGTLAYVGELTNADLGTMGKLAFDALKAIRYSTLAITLDGKLDGEIVSRVRFDGVRQAAGDRGLVSRMLRNLPFRFNIAIRAPFRALVGTARTYADPSLLLRDLGAPPAVQPAESAPVQ